jgi:xanthine dehydrogenase small subunit
MTNSASNKSFSLNLNGRSVNIVSGDCGVHTTLLDLLRERGLTGAKEGCAEGECGACTVVMVADEGGGSAYRTVNSCLMLAPMAAGCEIYTVEALAARGELCEAQKAMAAAGGSQCGYCTPGFVMSMFAEQYRPGRVGACDTAALGGNLCRCTGYRPIRDAALSLGPAPEGAFRDRLSLPAPRTEPMTYATGDSTFERPATLEECFAIAAEHPEACWIAGATDMSVEANLKFRRWPYLVSLEGVAELREFEETRDFVRIGAALPLTEIALRWGGAPPVFRDWLLLFASPPIRNRATLGGNLATASPIGDSAPLLMALDAVVHIAGAHGRRTVPVASFFAGYRRTALEPGEMLTAIEIPKPLASSIRFYKAAKRRVDDISTVAAGISMDQDSVGRVTRAVFAFGGVAPVPLRVYAAEEAALGQRWNQAAVERVQSVLEWTLKPISDHRGSAEYRVEVAKSLVEKFWWERQEAAA